jgi:hypothetical protein
MRIYSYLFHLALALFAFATASLALLSGSHNLNLDMLPWEGSALTYWLFGLSLGGLLLILLALKGVLRILFFLWTLGIAALFVWGFLFSRFFFRGSDGFFSALYFLAAALLACLGGWLQMRRKPSLRR